jgi:serine protease
MAVTLPEQEETTLNIRALLAVVAVTAAFAVPTTAAAAATPAKTPVLHVLTLHASAGRAAADRAEPRIAGVVPPRTEHHAQAAAQANLQYNGGPVQHSPHVYLLLWGPNWSGSSPAFDYMYSFYSGLGVTPQDNWSTVTSQYGDGSGQPGFGSSVFEGAWQDSSTPPDPVSGSDLSNEATAFIDTVSVPDLADAQIVIMSQSGTCFSDGFAGNCGSTSSGGSYCAWHSYTGSVSFTNLPYELDAGGECGENWINSGSAGTYDGFSTVGGHEYAESITDPQLDAWYDPSGAEIADKCAWTSPAGDTQLSTGSFAMQSLWSNAADGCVM